MTALAVGGTGPRHGELFVWSADRVDFLARQITVDRRSIMGGSNRNRFGPPKTRKSQRVIPVAQGVIDSVAAHLAEFGHLWSDSDDRTRGATAGSASGDGTVARRGDETRCFALGSATDGASRSISRIL